MGQNSYLPVEHTGLRLFFLLTHPHTQNKNEKRKALLAIVHYFPYRVSRFPQVARRCLQSIFSMERRRPPQAQPSMAAPAATTASSPASSRSTPRLTSSFSLPSWVSSTTSPLSTASAGSGAPSSSTRQELLQPAVSAASSTNCWTSGKLPLSIREPPHRSRVSKSRVPSHSCGARAVTTACITHHQQEASSSTTPCPASKIAQFFKHTTPPPSLDQGVPESRFLIHLLAPNGIDQHQPSSSETSDFLRFLREYVHEEDGNPCRTPYYESELLAMEKRLSYVLNISYDQMQEYATMHKWEPDIVNLLIHTCNRFQRSLEDQPILAAREFFTEKGLGNEDGRLKHTRLSFSGFPTRMQRLQDFLPEGQSSLVNLVHVFGGKPPILVATPNGRLLIEMFMVALSENHLNRKVSWDGRFDIADILIIDHGPNSKQIKILRDTVEASQEAMFNDLDRVAELIIPLYEKDKVLPVYFDQLRKELKKKTEKTAQQEDLIGGSNNTVGHKWFMDFLSYHVALMPSSGRRNFEITLQFLYAHPDIDDIPFMKTAPYCDDWRTLVARAKKRGIPMFHKVYIFDNKPCDQKPDKYDKTMVGLMRFKRNFLEHAKEFEQSMAEVELCAAHEFQEYLATLVRTLLEEGRLQTVFSDAWEPFKASRSDKSDPWSSN